ncbi:unnamed protein product [Macrosiphum euphorbiae]|uniref:PiggyBac transposable element-derived protein domain-containing protein n=1 Tax=Macrosiphum euphorbiae TaxID=13131 RepID=A0AAV0WKZ1_9HEMI|nr:unnamed protein product [Macrosiphum euphorbiae]
MNVKKKSQNNVFTGIEDLSSDDEEIDDTDKDKDYTSTVLECNESLEDFSLDLDLFLNDENILNGDITDNPPNISDFNFEKAGCSPEKYKPTCFREVHGSGNKNIYKMCPIQIFDMIMGNIMYQKIVFESSLYAEQHNISLNTNIEELKAFLGLLIYMGYHELPGIRLYWSINDPNFYCDRVAQVMPVQQFLKLLRCIHLNGNS